MTGIVFDIKKYAIHDGPGIRTTIFFKGCPLHCPWCHNPESINPQPEVIDGLPPKNNVRILINTPYIGKKVTVEEVMREIEKDLPFYNRSGGGVTFSGGEPLLQPDFLFSLLMQCRNKSINTVVDTSGFASGKIVELVAPYTDIFHYDLKLMDDKLHRKFTGVSNKLILDNLLLLAKTDTRIVIRIPLIPGITDSAENLKEIRDFIKDIPHIVSVDLLPYNKLCEDKHEKITKGIAIDKREVQKQAKLDELSAVFSDAGFIVNIGG